MSVKKEIFGETKNRERVYVYTVRNRNGMEVSFLDYGAVIQKILVPDKNGVVEDVALGYDTVSGYEEDKNGFGAFIGRHANRIGGAEFILGEKEYKLQKNEGENNLHGGDPGYHKVMYEAECFQEMDEDSIVFSRISPDMEQGFPGNLDISVTYTLTENNELVIEYFAVSDKDTIINLTNHTYFNLSGHTSGSIENHKLKLYSHYFTPTDAQLIPTGEICCVEHTPMDFLDWKRIGEEIDAEYDPLKVGQGYDHNFVLDENQGEEVRLAAEIIEEKSGRKMEVFTDLPGIQIYAGNCIALTQPGKKGKLYGKRDGICFETQFYPDSVHHENFPSCVIKAGQEYEYVTVYKFSNE